MVKQDNNIPIKIINIAKGDMARQIEETGTFVNLKNFISKGYML